MMKHDNGALSAPSATTAEPEKLEFFKLDEIDRKVIFWYMDNDLKALRRWLFWLSIQYSVERQIQINANRLYWEIVGQKEN